MTPREKRIVWSIAKGISMAQDMSADQRAAAVQAAFNGGMTSMQDYGLIAMCLLIGAASAPEEIKDEPCP